MACSTSSPPFPEHVALNTERLKYVEFSDPQPYDSDTASAINTHDSNGIINYIPGEPSVHLVIADVHEYLLRELNTPMLEELYPRLWYVARKSGDSIDPLHRQASRGRSITPSEDPKLHVVWHPSRVYLKPLPVCLLNYHFWTKFLPSGELKISATKSRPSSEKGTTISPRFDRTVALGFVRSYAFLIRHQSDFWLAREHHLIPEDCSWIQWSQFIVHFREIRDYEVANRYHYGQLRLSRLHWATRLFRPRSRTTAWFYEIPLWSISSYLYELTAPLLFIFATLSLNLASMQVVLEVPVNGLNLAGIDEVGLQAMRRAFWVFSIGVVFLSGFIWVLFVIIPLIVLIWQLSWGFQRRARSMDNEIAAA
ncbi:hypothetical protein MMC14_010753 [Varicellaria rhodocarpa]|nr:hypothetical protein [Varicellaria rhodocarpa]